MPGSQPKFPELRNKDWWGRNWTDSNNTIAKRLGCSGGTVHSWRRKLNIRASTQSGPYLGQIAEDFVAERIRLLGGNPEQQDFHAPFDLRLGDIRIDVKSAAPGPTNKAHPSPYYGFILGKSQREDCDFYILVAKHPEDWACFVVPSSLVLEGQATISFKWPAHHPKTNPWARYLERWDLLGLLE